MPYLLFFGGLIVIVILIAVFIWVKSGKDDDTERAHNFKKMYPVKEDGFNGEDQVVIWQKKKAK